MRQGYEALRAYIDKIRLSNAPEEVFDILWAGVKPFAFNSAMVARASGSMAMGEAAESYFVYHNLPAWWDKTYIEKNYVHIDPFARRAVKSTGPYRWSECYDDLTPVQEAMIADSKAHGLNFGINFPMHNTKGSIGVVLFGSETDFTLSPDDMIFLEILSRYGYDRIQDILGSPSEVAQMTLSEREREILTLVAHGKTNWEIGAILDLSEYSVRDYLKDVSKRMQTSNRTHTVTRAIQLGLILP